MVTIERQLVRAAAVRIRKHAEVSSAGVVVRFGVTVVRGVVGVCDGVSVFVGIFEGVRVMVGVREGEGVRDGVVIRDGDGVLDGVIVCDGTGVSYGPEANCRNSPVRSR